MVLFVALTVILALLISRIIYVFWQTSKPCHHLLAQKHCLKTLIVLGSGGHTAEMLNVISALNTKTFYPRVYIAALTDNLSLTRAATMEKGIKERDGSSEKDDNSYLQIYRSREVGQSYITSVFTTILATCHGLWIVFSVRPDIILCNGPGTCIPLCFAGFLLKILGIRWVVIVYIESIARVKHLSLSALILYKLKLADKIYVQWSKLKNKYPNCEFVGRLM